jgi:hypothetical protein
LIRRQSCDPQPVLYRLGIFLPAWASRTKKRTAARLSFHQVLIAAAYCLAIICVFCVSAAVRNIIRRLP